MESHVTSMAVSSARSPYNGSQFSPLTHTAAMEFESDVSPSQDSPVELAAPKKLEPLVVLRDTERSLRVKALETVTPILPEAVATNLGEVSVVADQSLEQLARIDLDSITDAELKSVRIQVGLAFVGFGALAMAFLLLYLYTLHPDLTAVDQVRQYWYQYIWFACLGVSGLFMLGREAMRPAEQPEEIGQRRRP